MRIANWSWEILFTFGSGVHFVWSEEILLPKKPKIYTKLLENIGASKSVCLSKFLTVSPASHVLSSYIGNASPRLIGAIVGWTLAFSSFSKERTHNVVMRMSGCASVRVSWCLFSIHHAMLILENSSLWMSVNEILTAHKQTASSPVSFELCCVSDTTMIEQCAYTHFSHTTFSLFVLMLLHTQQNRLLPKKVRLSSHRIW